MSDLKRVALFDYDKTLTRNFSAGNWMAALLQTATADGDGLIDRDHAAEVITAMRAYGGMDRDAKDARYISMVNDYHTGYARGLAGRSVAAVEAFAKQFAPADWKEWAVFTEGLLEHLHAGGFEVHIVSGSPVESLRAVFAPYPYVRVHAFEAERLADGTFSGAAATRGPHQEHKQQMAKRLCAGADYVLALGDAKPDIELFEAALRHRGHAVVVHPAGGEDKVHPSLAAYRLRVTHDTPLEELLDVVGLG